MKRTLAALSAVLLMLSMTACGAQTTETDAQNGQTEQEVSQMVNYGFYAGHGHPSGGH